MIALRMSLRFSVLILLAVSPAQAQVASLGKGWLLDSGGSITSAAGEVISGRNSIKASGTSHQFLESDPTFVRFAPNQSYTMTWSYRIIAASDNGFGYGFESSDGQGVGDFGPGGLLRGASGSSGTVTTAFRLNNHADYRASFSIGGTGSIVIDDIRIADTNGRLVASENAEGPSLAPGPLNFQLTDGISLLTDAKSSLRSLAVKDLNGDGYPEAVVTFTADIPSNIPLQAMVIEASGRMRLATSDFFPTGVPTVKHSPLTLFPDLNGDGLPDIVFAEAGWDGPCAACTGSRIGVALNLGGGKFRDVSSLIPADQQTTRSYAIAAGDFLGDGRIEILEPDELGPPGSTGANTVLLRWNGNGFDEIRNWIPSSLWLAPTNLVQNDWFVIADFDRDGRQDLLVGANSSPGPPNLRLLFGAAEGFSAANLLTLPDGIFPHAPNNFGPVVRTADITPSVAADFNNDGLPDLFVTEQQVIDGVFGDSGITVLLNQGSRRFVDVTSASSVQNLGGGGCFALFPMDVNNDGFLDVVGLCSAPIAGVTEPQWGTTFFLNDGTGAFQVVDGRQILAATTTPSDGRLWNLGSFVPTVVTPQRTEGIVVEQVGGCGTPGCPAKGLNLYKVVANGALSTGPNFVDPATLGVPGFNEFYYLRHYPDAAAAVQAGQYASGLAHYLEVGARKGYLPHAENGIVRYSLPAFTLNSRGAGTTVTSGTSPTVSTGYVTANVNSGRAPFATAVFTLKQNGVMVSEAGVPASPPIQNARLFIDYSTGVASGNGTIDINTGIALANPGPSEAALTFLLRDRNGQAIATGHGNLPPNAHRAKFVHELQDIAPDFHLPADFATTMQVGSLDIVSTQPVSLLGLRLTTNQRGETLLTSTSLADLSKPSTTSPFYFPQLVDGAGYKTTIVLSNTSSTSETGAISIFDDKGIPLSVQAGGGAGSTFPYSIPSGGVFVFQTDGSPSAVQTGWVKVTPGGNTSAPAGIGVLSFSPAGTLVTETGVASVLPTLHARVYVDKSGGHDTGIALGNPGNSPINVQIQTFNNDGSSTGRTADLNIAGNGHTARFAGELVNGLPDGFTGLADFNSTSPFVPLTLRTLSNARGDYLLTTLPAPDVTTAAPIPVVFPQVADGGGFSTQFIFISASGAATVSLDFVTDGGTPGTTRQNP